MLNGSNVLVAGGTGFIGSNLALSLVDKGCRVKATINRRPPPYDNSELEYIRVDLTNMEDCKRAVRGIDYVFMCAASTSGAAVINTNPLIHVTPNVIMNASIMDAAYKAGVKKFLFLSSNAAYPPTDDRPVKESQMFIGDPYDSYYGVGWMKRYGEILSIMYSQRLNPRMPVVVVRPSNVYGPLDDFEFGTSHMMAASIRRVVERHRPMEIWGTGNDVRDLIYIDDLVDGIIAVFEKTKCYSAVNLASGQGHTVKEVLKTIANVDGFTDAEMIFDPSKPSTIPVRLIDTAMARNQFGIEPRISFREGIRKTLRWYREAKLGHDQTAPKIAKANE